MPNPNAQRTMSTPHDRVRFLLLGFAASPLLAAAISIAPARAALCPDGTEAEFCFPQPAPPITPPVTPVIPVTPVAPQPKPPLTVNVDRLSAPLLPLGVGLGWQQFSRELLEELPQKVPIPAEDTRTSGRFSDGPELSFDPRLGWQGPLLDEAAANRTFLGSGVWVGGLPEKLPADAVAAMGSFRFSDVPGEYYSERQGWRARLFGGGYGGPVIQSTAGSPSASINGGQVGLRLDYALSEHLRVGAFGRFGRFWADGSSLGQGGGGLFVQVSKPTWFVGLAAGGDALQGDQTITIRSSNTSAVRTSTPSLSGGAFNLATSFGGRVKLSATSLLEPSALLTLSSVSLGSSSVFDGPTDRTWRLPSTNGSIGTADVGVTWRAPLRTGANLLTPSLRVSWLGSGFLGGTPNTVVRDSDGSPITLAQGQLVQGSGLGLQGQLAYTLADNTTFYVRGGAGIYGDGTAWNVGGGVQLRWGGATRAVAAIPAPVEPQPEPAPAPEVVPAPAPQPIRGLW